MPFETKPSGYVYQPNHGVQMEDQHGIPEFFHHTPIITRRTCTHTLSTTYNAPVSLPPKLPSVLSQKGRPYDQAQKRKRVSSR